MEERLDDLDISILRALQEDARIPFSKLAKMLKVPESTVKFRVKRLLERGIITKFVALLNPVKLGYNVTLVIFISCEPKKVNEVFNELCKLRESHHIFQLTGKYDFITVLHARDTKEANEIFRTIKSIDGVKEAEMMIATGLLKIKTSLPI